MDITDSINQMQTRYLCYCHYYVRLYISHSPQYLTFFQAEKITSRWISRDLRLTQVKARTSIVAASGRDARRKCLTSANGSANMKGPSGGRIVRNADARGRARHTERLRELLSWLSIRRWFFRIIQSWAVDRRFFFQLMRDAFFSPSEDFPEVRSDKNTRKKNSAKTNRHSSLVYFICVLRMYFYQSRPFCPRIHRG